MFKAIHELDLPVAQPVKEKAAKLNPAPAITIEITPPYPLLPAGPPVESPQETAPADVPFYVGSKATLDISSLYPQFRAEIARLRNEEGLTEAQLRQRMGQPRHKLLRNMLEAAFLDVYGMAEAQVATKSEGFDDRKAHEELGKVVEELCGQEEIPPEEICRRIAAIHNPHLRMIAQTRLLQLYEPRFHPALRRLTKEVVTS